MRDVRCGGPWSDTDKADVLKMWNAGKSATEIGRRFGVSRNAVLGIVHRLRAEVDNSRVAQDARGRQSGAMKGVIARAGVSREAPTLRAVVNDAPDDMAGAVSDLVTGLADAMRTPEAGGTGGMSLVALSAGQCRAPKGEGRAGEALFCGQPVRAFRQAYCAACHAELHVPKPQTRKVDRSYDRQAVRHGW